MATIKMFEDPTWSDVSQIITRLSSIEDDSDVIFGQVAAIKYPEAYKEAMKYFWIVYEKGELSERVYNLTTRIIDLCEGHYTIWHYRRKLVRALGVDPRKELSFIRQYTVERPKNYQLWRHREAMVTSLKKDDSIEYNKLYTDELADLELVLMDGPKNYHAWQYRQWLTSFSHTHHSQSIVDWKEELEFCMEFLKADPFNNSAWNHRYFVFLFCKTDALDEKEEQEEVELIKKMASASAAIGVANKSLVNYTNALIEKWPHHKDSLVQISF